MRSVRAHFACNLSIQVSAVRVNHSPAPPCCFCIIMKNTHVQIVAVRPQFSRALVRSLSYTIAHALPTPLSAKSYGHSSPVRYPFTRSGIAAVRPREASFIDIIQYNFVCSTDDTFMARPSTSGLQTPYDRPTSPFGSVSVCSV